MSEYELVTLFNSHIETMIAIFMAFVSTTSAFLIVTYLAATEFPRFLARVTVGLYSITSLTLMGIGERQAATIIGLRSQMEGVVFWHPAVYEAEWILPTALYSIIVTMLFLFVSSLWFFFFTRQRIETPPNQSLEVDA